MDLFKLVGTIAIDNAKANDAIDETTDKAEGSQSKMTGAFKKIGGAVATYFAVDKIIDFGKEVVGVAAEVAAETSAFEQIMGDYTNEASEKVGKIAEATGMVDSRLTPYMTSMTAKFKGLGYDVADATDFASRGLNLAADASAFWDKSLDESMSHLNSFINGSYEGGEAIGLFANDTQLASYAVKTGLIEQTKEWSALDEATKQATRLEYAENMMKQSGATGQAAKESEQYANVQANLSEKWRQFKAQIGEPLLQNIVIPAMDKLSGIVDTLSTKFEEWKPHIETIFEKLQGLGTWITEHQGILQGLAVVIGIITTALGLQSIAQGITTAMNAAETTTIWGLVAAKLASAAASMVALAPYILIAAAIAAVIAIIVLCVKHWDTIKAKVLEVAEKIKNKITEMKNRVVERFNELKSKVVDTINNLKKSASDKFTEIKEKITSPIEKARDKVKEIIDKIKGFFDFTAKTPKIKLPHFSITPKGWKLKDLLDGVKPTLGIEWYAKAMNNPMLMKEPTIFGYNAATGNFRAGGEKGDEVVSGANTLMGMIRNAVISVNGDIAIYLQQIITILADFFPQIIENMGYDIVFDDDTMVARLVPKVNRELGKLQKLESRGR